jgi:hypothetical protein
MYGGSMPLAMAVDVTAADLVRFARFIRVAGVPDSMTTPCHEWQGCTDKDGYPQFKYAGRKVKAHRWIAAAMIRPLEDGEDVDHVCRNRACVNDEHLQPKPLWENRGWHPPESATSDDDVPF